MRILVMVKTVTETTTLVEFKQLFIESKMLEEEEEEVKRELTDITAACRCRESEGMVKREEERIKKPVTLTQLHMDHNDMRVDV